MTATLAGVNSVYHHFYGPDSELHHECAACLYELSQIGPVHGPDRPRKRRKQRIWVYR
ncbi:hypothetical protein J4U02_gp119 [Mycobacterium phage Aziz]|uniref:Uncharacterized protein n=1 Tax=Mycobacterium phage Aziz TaxID=2762281 RepID=A0A7G8LHS1_9CAUD|nr:hypothetical protein J4U02_gp119 [Mycobacterium phage Aziz]ASR75980.1 hypothetical protein SEA_GENEVAB15_159 [Mycobacterium phage GenevaB15]QNJ56793.1 hypothetical protein SEA_AZIZ_155 [Mycobacterium phage Aziz]